MTDQNTEWLQPAAGGVTAAAGFRAGTAAADIRGNGSERLDVCVLAADYPVAAAGVFTTNRVQAAPVVLSRRRVAGGYLRAIAINAGNANACTGDAGLAAAETAAAAVAERLDCRAEQVAVASTGVIGVPLPLDRLLAGLDQAVARLADDGGESAARAIMTTDTRPKEAAVSVELAPGWVAKVGGMAKGAGMIEPNMATMLAFITTDAPVGPAALQQALTAVVDETFNMITVDGDTSTNDSVFVLASGAVGGPQLQPGTAPWERFVAALRHVCTELAKAIARDGEGATKLIEVQVEGAATVADARLAAKAIARSPLVKTAVYGADANWGRILCAAGYSGADFDPAAASLWLGPILVAERGQGVAFDEAAAQQYLSGADVQMRLRLGDGPGAATAWGCDLTHEYVNINGSYRT